MRRSVLASALTVLSIAACSEGTAPLEPFTGRHANECTDEGPTEPGCPVQIQFTSELETDVAQDVGFATGAEPLWSGESFAEVMESSERFCPSFYKPGKISWYVPEFGENAVFDLPGTAYLQAVIGRTVLGFPMARYSIPISTLTSTEPAGKYKIFGNVTLYVVCNMVRFRTSRGRLVEGGFMRIYNMEANIQLTEPGGASGSSDRGWAWQDSFTGQEYKNGAGQGSDWRAALDTYIETGVCTRGWEIWVDGEQLCDGT